MTDAPASPMPAKRCPQCGAQVAPGGQCRDRFDLCLAAEFSNPITFGTVHHLTVPCYMLQHNAYSREGWLATRQLLAQFVREGATPAQVRRQQRARFDSRQREWSFTKGAKLAEFSTIVWTCTIADVRLDDPDAYCADVKVWAAAMLSDTDKLFGKAR